MYYMCFIVCFLAFFFFFFKQKTAYEMRISDWSSDVCSSDLLSAEWYYGRDSYLSVGYFHKDVSNFISSTRIDANAFGLTTPIGGPRWNAAIAALGSGATVADIRAYIIDTFPDTVTGNILHAAPGDPLVNFEISTDWKSVLWGKRVSVRLYLGCAR